MDDGRGLAARRGDRHAGAPLGHRCDELSALFASEDHAPSPITDAEAAGAAQTLADAPAHVRADLPEWLAPRFERVFGDRWIAEGEALALRPPLDMRANRLKADRLKVLKALERYAAAASPFAPDGMRIAATERDGRHPNVQVEQSFLKGWFEIQDEGSQLAAAATGAKPGEQVLDLCAGAGGKTLALSAMMANKGQVFATDSDRSRLAPIYDRIRRAGARNVQIREAGAPLTELAGRMDLVLVDAPCTGTGVWRRRPDAKWRLTEKALADRVAEQAALLESRPLSSSPAGGSPMSPVRCSPRRTPTGSPNSPRRAAMFTPTPGAAILDAFAAEKERLAAASHASPAGIMFTPAATGTDGFFVAMLRRAGGDGAGGS